VLQKLPLNAAGVALRAQRTRSREFLPAKRPARMHPRGNEAGLPRYDASFLSRPHVASRLLIIHHSPLFTFPHRERLRMRVQILHPNANAVVPPRIPSRRPMRTPITSSQLNLARQPRRRGQVGPARSQTIDTIDHLSYFEAITIAPQERLTLHVQDPFVHNVEQHTL
jgi:hypothetical protein